MNSTQFKQHLDSTPYDAETNEYSSNSTPTKGSPVPLWLQKITEWNDQALYVVGSVCLQVVGKISNALSEPSIPSWILKAASLNDKALNRIDVICSQVLGKVSPKSDKTSLISEGQSEQLALELILVELGQASTGTYKEVEHGGEHIIYTKNDSKVEVYYRTESSETYNLMLAEVQKNHEPLELSGETLKALDQPKESRLKHLKEYLVLKKLDYAPDKTFCLLKQEGETSVIYLKKDGVVSRDYYKLHNEGAVADRTAYLKKNEGYSEV